MAKSAIVRLFSEDVIDRIDVFPTEDQAGEDGLSITIFLKGVRDNVSGARLVDTIAAVSQSLRNNGDLRFPYVTFLAPGYDHAEDDSRSSA